MIRNGMRIRLQRQLERECQARAEQTQVALLVQRWKVFPLLLQVELQLHLSQFGLVAAEHATSLVERVFSGKDEHLMSEDSHQRFLAQEQIAHEYHWSVFPAEIQEKLFLHSRQFDYGGDSRRARMDVQSATDTLHSLVAGSPLDTLLIEHKRYFGQASTEYLVNIALHLATLLEQQLPP